MRFFNILVWARGATPYYGLARHLIQVWAKEGVGGRKFRCFRMGTG